jgi:carbon storage regulator
VLVLTRRIDESIVINGEIVITVLEVGRNGQVRLGIEAPRHYQIYRHELLLEIQRENRDALSSAAPPGPPAAPPAGGSGPAAP